MVISANKCEHKLLCTVLASKVVLHQNIYSAAAQLEFNVYSIEIYLQSKVDKVSKIFTVNINQNNRANLGMLLALVACGAVHIR